MVDKMEVQTIISLVMAVTAVAAVIAAIVTAAKYHKICRKFLKLLCLSYRKDPDKL